MPPILRDEKRDAAYSNFGEGAYLSAMSVHTPGSTRNFIYQIAVPYHRISGAILIWSTVLVPELVELLNSPSVGLRDLPEDWKRYY